jgi:hypothetical protein
MTKPLQQFRVLAKQHANEAFREVYRTPDEENASCFAESHFINRHAFAVRAVDEQERPLRDRAGREFVWQRQA